MTFVSTLRKLHYWATAFVAAPLLVIVSTGLLLQVKKQWDFVQPPEHRGEGASPSIDLEAILTAARSAPEAGVATWDDVRRVDVRPDRGLAKVWTRTGHEVQVDLSDGAVLHVAVRRSDLIESLHDGSFFGGDGVKLFVFLPAGAVLLFMWFSGLWLFVYPFVARRRKRGVLKVGR
jgi:uncharacterized iron-regulated membrane protein